MRISQALLPEFDHEMTSTRKILERVPEDKFDYKPHQKSMPLGRLASHVAELPGWAKFTVELEGLDLQPGQKAFWATSHKELLDAFEKNVREGRAAIAAATDEALMKTWTLSVSGTPVLSMPRATILRGMVMNHLIHHRGQLGVYLRLNEIAIPGMYGPSADEK